MRAADRGVLLRIVVEANNEHGGRSIRAKLYALGESVARRAAVYYWPADRQLRDEQGSQGVLHAKCAVGDGRWLFLSSANLTENAFSLNVELGVLVEGGPLAGQVEAQFQRLIEAGMLAGM